MIGHRQALKVSSCCPLITNFPHSNIFRTFYWARLSLKGEFPTHCIFLKNKSGLIRISFYAGTYLTKQQKEAQARNQAFLETMKARGLEVPQKAEAERRPKLGTRVRKPKAKSETPEPEAKAKEEEEAAKAGLFFSPHQKKLPPFFSIFQLPSYKPASEPKGPKLLQKID